MIPTPKDIFGRPAILGNFNGDTVPVKVTEDGTVCITGNSDTEKPIPQCRYELVEVITLDLANNRKKINYQISFDCFAVVNLDGSFFIHIGNCEDNKKCTINKCLSVSVSAEQIYISNEVQQGSAEIWFFRLKEA